MQLVLSDESDAAAGRTLTSSVNGGRRRWGGTASRDAGGSGAVSSASQRAAARIVTSRPADSAFDVRNDEFGLCEVNNAKMDCYPEHACYRAMRPYIRGPLEMTVRPPAGSAADCVARLFAVAGGRRHPTADTSPGTKKPDYRIYFDIRWPRLTTDRRSNQKLRAAAQRNPAD